MRAIFLIPTLPPPTLGTKVGGWREQIVDFVGRCVVKEVEHRPFTSELLSHPLIAEGRAAQQSGVLLRLMETSREPLRAWRPRHVDVDSAARATPQLAYRRASRHGHAPPWAAPRTAEGRPNRSEPAALPGPFHRRPAVTSPPSLSPPAGGCSRTRRRPTRRASSAVGSSAAVSSPAAAAPSARAGAATAASRSSTRRPYAAWPRRWPA